MPFSCYETIAHNRYRESPGLWFEDFIVGDVFEHRPGRTVTEVDNVWQSLLAMNAHPLHCDAVYAAKTEFRQLLVASPVTFAIIGGLTVSTLSAKGVANLGWDNVRLPKPVFVGDTLYAESEILSTRPCHSRPRDGIVKALTTGKNQKDETVITFERTFMVPFRSAPAERTP